MQPALLEAVQPAAGRHRPEAPLERGAAGRQVPAQADPADPHPRSVDVAARQQVVNRARRGDLEVHPHLHLIPGLALAGAVQGQGRQPAPEEERFERGVLLLGGVQPGEKEHDRRTGRAAGLPEIRRDPDRLQRKLDTLAGRIQEGQGVAVAVNALPVPRVVLGEVVDPAEDGEVIGERRPVIGLTGGHLPAVPRGVLGQVLVLPAEPHPGRVPLLPGREAGDRPLVVVGVDPVREKPRLPAPDDAGERGVRYCHRGSPVHRPSLVIAAVTNPSCTTWS